MRVIEGHGSKEGFLWDASTDSFQSGLSTPTAKSDTQTSYPNTYDVIVIGAGFAGLTAARDLSQNHNKKVLLLEARDRIGGRTWLAHGQHASYEMGGSWIHPLQKLMCAELKRYDLEGFKRSFIFDGEDKFESGVMGMLYGILPLIERFLDVDGQKGRTVFEAIQEHGDAAMVKKWDISIRERIDQMKLPEVEAEALDQWFEEVCYTPAAEASFLMALIPYGLSEYSYKTFIETMDRYKINGGTSVLANAMFKDFTESGGVALFKRVVKSISTETETARVTLVGDEGEAFTAEKVICTVPANCLGDIDFQPPPKVPLEQLKHLHRGGKVHIHASKQPKEIILQVPDPRDPDSFLDVIAESPSRDGGANCMTFIASKEYGREHPIGDTPEKLVAEMKLRLKGSDLDITDMTWHDWRNDRFAKGTWAIWGKGMTAGVLGDIMHNGWVSDRVLVAGGDIARGWMGYMEGAIEQGKSAAAAIGSE